MTYALVKNGGYGATASVIDSDSSHSDSIIVPDAQLLFTADFRRAGPDLVLVGHDGRHFIVSGYFASEHRPTLVAPNGARLSPDLIDLLAGSPAPNEYAQAQPTPPIDSIGKVQKVSGTVTVVRNGVSVALNVGDVVYKSDVVVTGADSKVGLTFPDGTALELLPNTRMALNEYTYDPNGSSNSALFTYVSGTFGFFAGKVAHSGNMKIDTPVATMGIRGTTGVMGQDKDADGNDIFWQVIYDDPHTTRSGAWDDFLRNADGTLFVGVTVSQTDFMTIFTLRAGQPPDIKTIPLLDSYNAIGQQIIQELTDLLGTMPRALPGTTGSPEDPLLKFELNFFPGVPGGGGPFTYNYGLPGLPNLPQLPIPPFQPPPSNPSNPSNTFIWPTGSGTWPTGSQWNQGIAPTPNSIVIIESGDVDYDLPLPPLTIFSLTIDGPGELDIIGGQLIVTNGLDVAGTLLVGGDPPKFFSYGPTNIESGGKVIAEGKGTTVVFSPDPSNPSATSVSIDNFGAVRAEHGGKVEFIDAFVINEAANAGNSNPDVKTPAGRIISIGCGSVVDFTQSDLDNAGRLAARWFGEIAFVDSSITNEISGRIKASQYGEIKLSSTDLTNDGVVLAERAGRIAVYGGSVENQSGADITAREHGVIIFESIKGNSLAVTNDAGGNITADDCGIITFKDVGLSDLAGAKITAKDGGIVTFIESTDSAAGIINQGTIAARHHGVVAFIDVGGSDNGGVTNAGGTIEAIGCGAEVTLADTVIIDGTLLTREGGVIESVCGYNALINVTLDGAVVRVDCDTTLALVDGLGLGSAAVVDGTVTFEGGGTVLMDYQSYKIVAGSDDATLTNDSNIFGLGQIGTGSDLTFINEGVLEAHLRGTGHGDTFTIDTGANTVTNDGVMQADDGTLLDIDSKLDNFGGVIAQGGSVAFDANVVNEAGGLIEAKSGGIVTFADVEITNEGCDEDTSAARIVAKGEDSLVSIVDSTVDNHGDITAKKGGHVDIDGSIVHNRDGVIKATGVGSVVELSDSTVTGGAMSVTHHGLLDIEGNTALDGVDTAVGANANIDIGETTNGSILTLERGAKMSGGTLTVESGSALDVESNLGAMLDGVAVVNQGGTIHVDFESDPTVPFTLEGGTTITGGELSIGNHGLLQVEGDSGATFDDVDVDVHPHGKIEIGTTTSGSLLTVDDGATISGGTLIINSGSTLDLENGLTVLTGVDVKNHGNLQVDDQNITATLALGSGTTVDGHITVGGTGELDVDGAALDGVTIDDGGIVNFDGPVTLDGDVTINVSDGGAFEDTGPISIADGTSASLSGVNGVNVGTVNIGSNAIFSLDNAQAAIVDFVGSDGTLGIDSAGDIPGMIADFAKGDVIDLTDLAFSTTEYDIWTQGVGGGTLAIWEGSTLEETLNLSGAYCQNQFELKRDSGAGGTDVLLIDPVLTGSTSETVDEGSAEVTLGVAASIDGTVTITGLPSDLTHVNGGTYNADTGTWAGSAADFNALSFTAGDEGTFDLVITETASGDSSQTTTDTYTLTIADAPLTGSSAATVEATEGTAAQLTDATFTDANPGDHHDDFTASIDWGDDSASSSGIVTYDSTTKTYSVAGTHTYAEDGSYNVTVTVDDDGKSSTTITGTATIDPTAPTVSSTTATGIETQSIALNLASDIAVTGATGDSNSIDTVTLTFTVPTGDSYTFTSASDPAVDQTFTAGANQTLTLTQQEIAAGVLGDLSLTTVNASNVSLAISATEQDSHGDVSAAGTGTETVTVDPTAPSVSSATVTGLEMAPIALDLASVITATDHGGDTNSIEAVTLTFTVPAGATYAFTSNNIGLSQAFSSGANQTLTLTQQEIAAGVLGDLSLTTTNALGASLSISATQQDSEGDVSAAATGTETVKANALTSITSANALGIVTEDDSYLGNLILNGGFETWSYNYQTGVYTIPDWTFGRNFYYPPGVGTPAHSGGAALDVYNYNLGTGVASESFATDIGQTYQVTFYVYKQQGSTTNSFSVLWNGTTEVSLVNWTNFGSYYEYQFNAVATTSTSTLQFDFNSGVAGYWFLDDVSVVPAGSTPGTEVRTGTITFTDTDAADSHNVSVTPQGGGYLGTFTATVTQDSTGGKTGNVTWNFTVSDSALASLAPGQEFTQTYEVTVNGVDSAPVQQAVSIELVGIQEPTGFAFTAYTAGLSQLQQGDHLNSGGGGEIGTFTQSGGPAGDNYTFSVGGSGLSYFSPDGLIANEEILYTANTQTVPGSNPAQVYALTVTVTDTTNGGRTGALPFDVVVGDANANTINLETGTNNLGISAATPTIVYGLNGNDIINATDMTANIWFVGGQGAETMTGGTGINRYLYGSTGESKVNGADAITNFHTTSATGADNDGKNDIIDLSGITFGGSVSIGAGTISSGKISADSIGWIQNGTETDVYVNATKNQETLTSANMKVVLQNFTASWLSANNFSYTGHVIPAGVAGAPINLALTNPAAAQGADVTVTIRDVPAGWVLDGGRQNADGSWTVQTSDLSSLAVTTTAAFAGAAVLSVIESWTNPDGSTGLVYVADNVEASTPGNPIFALAGDDVLTGAGGNDLYVFAQPIGNDVIHDFNAASDKIDLVDFSNVAGFADLHIADDANGNAVITSGAGETITLDGVATASLTAGDFLFNQAPVVDNASLMTIGDGAVLPLGGSIENTGSIAVDSTGDHTELQIVGGNLILDGGGQFTLSGDALVAAAATATTLTNVDNAILGGGEIGTGDGTLSLVNAAHGIIDGNVAGATLTLDTGTAIENFGLLEASTGGTLLVVDDVNNSGTLAANGGTLHFVNAVVNSGAGNAVIASGVLEFDAAANVKVSFDNGQNGATYGELVLKDAAQFSGEIFGFAGTAPDQAHSDVIDLTGIDFNSAGFAESYNASTGALALTDGSDAAALTFVNFDGTLDFAADGHGGTLIFDPPANENGSTPNVIGASSGAPNAAQTPAVSIGGAGNDNFVFAPGIGADTVLHFDVQRGTIELDHFANVQTAQQLQALITTDAHGDAFIGLDNHDSITFANTTAAQLQQVVQAGHVLLH